MKNKNVLVIVILLLIILVLVSYILYDNFTNTSETTSNAITNNVNTTSNTIENITNTTGELTLTHNYTNILNIENEILIKINGHHTEIKNINGVAGITPIHNYSGITNLNNSYNCGSESYGLANIFNIPAGVTDCSNLINASNLLSIPITFTIPNTVINCSNMFTNQNRFKQKLLLWQNLK